MPARLSKQARDRFLRGRHVAVLVTLNEDGSPQPAPIWYLYRDGVFFFRTAEDAVRTKNIRRDPRVSICVQDERAPYKSVIARGKAAFGEAHEGLGRDMPRHYLGMVGGIAYKSARAQIEQGAEITLTVRPDGYLTQDFSSDTPWYGRIWLLAKRVLPPWL